MPSVDITNTELNVTPITSGLSSYSTYDITGLTSIIGEQIYKLHGSDNVLADYRRAILQYSIDFPYKIIEDFLVISDGIIKIPDKFVIGLSKILSVEYPIGYQPAKLYNEYFIYTNNERESFIQLPSIKHDSVIRLSYTAVHLYSLLTEREKYAINYLTASLICESMSIKTINEINSLGATGETKSMRSTMFNEKAKSLMDRYLSITGLPAHQKNSASGQIISIKTKFDL